MAVVGLIIKIFNHSSAKTEAKFRMNLSHSVKLTLEANKAYEEWNEARTKQKNPQTKPRYRWKRELHHLNNRHCNAKIEGRFGVTNCNKVGRFTIAYLWYNAAK